MKERESKGDGEIIGLRQEGRQTARQTESEDQDTSSDSVKVFHASLSSSPSCLLPILPTYTELRNGFYHRREQNPYLMIQRSEKVKKIYYLIKSCYNSLRSFLPCPCLDLSKSCVATKVIDLDGLKLSHFTLLRKWEGEQERYIIFVSCAVTACTALIHIFMSELSRELHAQTHQWSTVIDGPSSCFHSSVNERGKWEASPHQIVLW